MTRFSGWMFASSPALSAMEHPVYDLWVLDCDNQDGTPAAETPALDNQPAEQPAQDSGAAPAD